MEDAQTIFGEWQLCPKCNGNGIVYPFMSAVTSPFETCNVCYGAKILARPILNTVPDFEKPTPLIPKEDIDYFNRNK